MRISKVDNNNNIQNKLKKFIGFIHMEIDPRPL
jgi:hypothetical protein